MVAKKVYCGQPGHGRFVSNGKLQTAIPKLLEENKSLEKLNCCKMFTKFDIVSAKSINDDKLFNLTCEKF